MSGLGEVTKLDRPFYTGASHDRKPAQNRHHRGDFHPTGAGRHRHCAAERTAGQGNSAIKLVHMRQPLEHARARLAGVIDEPARKAMRLELMTRW